MRRLLGNLEPVLFGDGFEGRVVGHLAEEVDCDNGLGLGRDDFFDLLGVDVIRVRLDVGKDGRCADQCDGLERC